MGSFTATNKQGQSLTFESQGDTPPTEQEIQQAFQQAGTQVKEPQSKFLSNEPMLNESAGLTFGQNFILSLAPNDNVRLDFLKRELSGKDVKKGVDGLTVDGLPVNPKGFDGGDIARSIGGVLPLAGQIAGSILGLPGGLAGAAALGVGGSMLGKGLQLTMGKALGLNPDGNDVFNAMVEDAQAAAIGEVAGLGLGAIAAKLGGRKALAGVADGWKKSFDKLGKDLTPTVAQFVGSIKPSATKIFQRDGFNKLERALDPNRITQITNKTLFGKEDAGLSEQFFSKSDIQKGTVDIVKSIKQINSPSYDNLIKFASNDSIDNNLINSIKRFSIEDLTNPIHTDPSRAMGLADGIIGAVKVNIKRLGENLGEAELKAIAKTKGSFEIKSISKNIDTLAKQVEVGKSIKIKGLQPFGGVEVAGAKKLREIQNIFKGRLTLKAQEKLRREGVSEIKIALRQAPKDISFKQAKRLKNNFDIKVGEFFNDPRIPGQLRNSVRQIAEEFRGQYYSRLNIVDEAASFRHFQNILDDISIDKSAGRKSIELLVKGFSNRSGVETGRLTNILNNVAGGENLIKNMELFQAGNSLSRINSRQISDSFSKKISTGDILDLVSNSQGENLLKSIDDSLLGKASSRKFFVDAQQALAGKEFAEGTPNLLRVQSLARISGLSTIGGLLGGPIGAGVAGTGALILQNPRTIGKILVAAERRAVKKAGKKELKKVSSGKLKIAQGAVLRGLIAQSQR